jgi:sugar-specific transcriptional regulator TrmB
VNSHIEQNLAQFGLSPKEAQTYLALLELGTALVTDVAKKADLNRSTTYVILEALSKQGLVSITERKKIRFYTGASPDRIVANLENNAKRSLELVGIAKSLLPELKSLYSGSGPKPKIQFFEGPEGIKTAYEDTLTSSETIRAFASIESMHSTLPGYFPEYYKKRAKKGINIRSIFPDTPESRDRIKNNKEEKRESLLVPKNIYSFTPEINVYDKKVVFMSLKEKFALIIESEELADGLKKAFELAWLGAKNYE